MRHLLLEDIEIQILHFEKKKRKKSDFKNRHASVKSSSRSIRKLFESKPSEGILYIYLYIIGHYKPSVRIKDIASHPTSSLMKYIF